MRQCVHSAASTASTRALQRATRHSSKTASQENRRVIEKAEKIFAAQSQTPNVRLRACSVPPLSSSRIPLRLCAICFCNRRLCISIAHTLPRHCPHTTFLPASATLPAVAACERGLRKDGCGSTPERPVDKPGMSIFQRCMCCLSHILSASMFAVANVGQPVARRGVVLVYSSSRMCARLMLCRFL